MDTRTPTKRPFVSPATAADTLGVAYATVLSAIKRGDLPFIKIGKVYRIPREFLIGAIREAKKK